MKKVTLILGIVLTLTLLIAGTALAITNGQPDGDDHPYVGLLVFDFDGGPAWRCSGALIAPDVVLTAGHCTDGAEAARIWFAEEVSAVWDDPPGEYPFGGSTSIEGTPFTNPDFGPGDFSNGLPGFSKRDVGIVVLDEPMFMDTYAELPAAGMVDTLANKTAIDFVGYGVQYQAKIPGSDLPQPPPYYRWTGPRARYYAPSTFVSGKFSFSDENMRLSLNPGGGKGGTCFGDSGGPDLLGGTETVLAVNSFVTNINCSGVGYSSRVDIPEVLDWIYSFMP
jgi:hypothetical protein